MGLKENFSQAVRELTGGNKDEKDKKSSQVNDLKKALNDEEEKPVASSVQTAVEPGEDVSAPYYREDEQSYTAAREDGNFAQSNTSNQYTAPQQNAYNAQQNTYNAQQNTYNAQQNAYGYGQQPNASDVNQNPQPQYYASHSTMQQEVSDNDELTVISKNTVIDGNVRSFANMSIDGNIKGDVETTKNVNLNGKIVGNITCNNANMLTSQVQGNVLLKGAVNIERDTLLIGDISSTYATINGKVKGNVDITGKAQFKADSVIFGDISASTITVDDGAIIQGYVSTTFLNKEESANIFPDTIAIGE